MKLSAFEKVIRKVVREEIDYALRREIALLKEELIQNPKPQITESKLNPSNEEFKKKIHDVKNLIYNNINNNLVYINKSKGTEKSFRNLLRCFGISDEVVKLNMYADNITYDLQDNFRGSTGKKRFINFNNPDRHEATVYQTASADNSNSVNYVSGSGISGSFSQEKGFGLTTEVEVIFPRKLEIEHEKHFHFFDLTSSIAGCHTVNPLGSTSIGFLQEICIRLSGKKKFGEYHEGD